MLMSRGRGRVAFICQLELSVECPGPEVKAPPRAASHSWSHVNPPRRCDRDKNGRGWIRPTHYLMSGHQTGHAKDGWLY